jgi:hypothetical protein
MVSEKFTDDRKDRSRLNLLVNKLHDHQRKEEEKSIDPIITLNNMRSRSSFGKQILTETKR